MGKPQGDLVKHVLGTFSKEDREDLNKVLEAVAMASETIIKGDAKEAMNKYNGFSLEKTI